MALLPGYVSPLSSSLEQDTALLASIRRRRRETARHGCEAPFLHIRFDENETHLSEVDMDCAGSIGTDCGKEILCFKSMGDVVELLAVACEEDRSTSRSVSNTDNVTLYILRAVTGWSEGLVEPTVTG